MTDLIPTSQAITAESAVEEVDYVADWLKFVKDKTPSTVQTYNKSIKRWFKYLRDNGISNPNRDTVVEYRDFLQAQVDAEKLSDNTARLYMTALKMFVRWLSFRGYTTNYADGVAGIKVDTSTHRKDALTADEGKKVLAAMQGLDEKSLRDKTIVALMMSVALRSVEVVRLNYGNIVTRRGKMFLAVHGKGRSGKDFVMLPPQINKMIEEYKAVQFVSLQKLVHSLIKKRLADVDVDKEKTYSLISAYVALRDATKEKDIDDKKVYALIDKYIGKIDEESIKKIFSLLEDYLGKHSPLFKSTSRSCKGERLQTQSISRLAKTALKNAGFNSPRLTCHSMRHTAITLMYLAKDEGAKISESDIQNVARHKSISTTQIYRHDLDIFKNNATYYAAGSLFGDWHNR